MNEVHDISCAHVQPSVQPSVQLGRYCKNTGAGKRVLVEYKSVMDFLDRRRMISKTDLL